LTIWIWLLPLLADFFAGTALYVSVGEVPAMGEFGVDEHWRYFPHMYKRAAASQAAFATIAGVAGIIHSTRIVGAPFDRNLWIISGSIFVGMFPYTFLGLLPTNKTIINDNEQVKLGHQSQIPLGKRKELLDKWAALHLVRTVGSVVGFGIMVYGLSRHSSLLLKW